MDALFEKGAALVGASSDQLKVIFCLLVCFPLGSVFVRIPRDKPYLKHLFSIGVSLFFLLPVFKLYYGTAQLLASTLFTYVVAKNFKGPGMPWVVFFVVMGHLLANHVYRALYEISLAEFEITSAQMVLLIKLSTFAFNVWDGRRPVEDLDKYQLSRRIVEFPSLLEFLGYAFYFPGFLVGPACEYNAYASLINETLFVPTTNATSSSSDSEKEEKPKSGKRVPKGRKRVAYRKLVQGLVFLGAYVLWGPTFDYEVILQDWFAKKSFGYRFLYFQLIGLLQRTKYYSVWQFTEGASILTGLGFNGYLPNGETKWDSAANLDIRNIEFAPNFKVLLDSWNMKTNVWLRECVYKRVTPKGRKPGFRSSMLTFLTSAIWHGIAGGYYLTFVFGGFVQTAQRLVRSTLRPLFLPPLTPAKPLAPPPQTPAKRLYDMIGTVTTVCLLNYIVTPFCLLEVRKSLAAWHQVGWYGHVLIAGGLAFFWGGGKGFLRGIQKKRVEKAMGQGAEKMKPKVDMTPGTVTPAYVGEGGVLVVPPPLDNIAQEVDSALQQKLAQSK